MDMYNIRPAVASTNPRENDPNYILNPTTGRYVLKSGSVGKRLMGIPEGGTRHNKDQFVIRCLKAGESKPEPMINERPVINEPRPMINERPTINAQQPMMNNRPVMNNRPMINDSRSMINNRPMINERPMIYEPQPIEHRQISSSERKHMNLKENRDRPSIFDEPLASHMIKSSSIKPPLVIQPPIMKPAPAPINKSPLAKIQSTTESSSSDEPVIKPQTKDISKQIKQLKLKHKNTLASRYFSTKTIQPAEYSTANYLYADANPAKKKLQLIKKPAEKTLSTKRLTIGMKKPISATSCNDPSTTIMPVVFPLNQQSLVNDLKLNTPIKSLVSMTPVKDLKLKALVPEKNQNPTQSVVSAMPIKDLKLKTLVPEKNQNSIGTKTMLLRDKLFQTPLFDSAIINVYTDGSVLNNGANRHIAKGGIGVFFGPNDPRNLSEKFTMGAITNQRAELWAIIRALEILKDNATEKSIVIWTDSMYALNIYTGKWNAKDNLDLVTKGKQLIKLFSKLKLKHVRAHTNKKDANSAGNHNADQLARSANGFS